LGEGGLVMEKAELTIAAMTAIFNLLIAGAAVAGAVIAGMGLNTWKRQSKWEISQDLAKRILVAIYEYRNSLYSVRHPAMSNQEMEISEEQYTGIQSGGDKWRAGTINAYANRWDNHNESQVKLDSLVLEADAFWGDDLRKLLEPIRKLEKELFSYIRIHIDAHLRGNTEIAKEYRKIIKESRDILYDSLSDEDEFRVDFTNQLNLIEVYLREKLGAS
jgi:hypothetical protein